MSQVKSTPEIENTIDNQKLIIRGLLSTLAEQTATLDLDIHDESITPQEINDQITTIQSILDNIQLQTMRLNDF